KAIRHRQGIQSAKWYVAESRQRCRPRRVRLGVVRRRAEQTANRKTGLCQHVTQRLRHRPFPAYWFRRLRRQAIPGHAWLRIRRCPELPLLRWELLGQIKRGGCSFAVPDLGPGRVEDWGNKKLVRLRQAEIIGNRTELGSGLVLLFTNRLEENQTP